MNESKAPTNNDIVGVDISWRDPGLRKALSTKGLMMVGRERFATTILWTPCDLHDVCILVEFVC